jgi:hypothetical protein
MHSDETKVEKGLRKIEEQQEQQKEEQQEQEASTATAVDAERFASSSQSSKDPTSGSSEEFGNGLADQELNEDGNSREANCRRLAEWLKTFNACEDGNLTVGSDGGYRYSYENLDIELILGLQNKVVHLSTVVRTRPHQQQEDTRRKSSSRNRLARTMPRGHYSFMTKMMKINAVHTDLNVRIYQGKILALESVDISLLQKGRKHIFFEHLRNFQTHSIGIEHELRNV